MPAALGARSARQIEGVEVDVADRCVCLRHHDGLPWPVDAKAGVVPPQSARTRRVVANTDVVVEVRIVLERDESVGETGGDEQRQSILGSEFDAQVLEPGRGSAPEVDDHVPDRAANTSHEFGLSVGPHVVVHATKRACAVVDGEVALREVRRESRRRELVDAERPRERAALVDMGLQLHYGHGRHGCRAEPHGGERTEPAGEPWRRPRPPLVNAGHSAVANHEPGPWITARRGAPTDSPRIALFGLFGIGNIGNEATLRAGIGLVKRRFPLAELVVVCPAPHAVNEQHGVEAVSIATGGRCPTTLDGWRPLRLVGRATSEPLRWLSIFRFLKSVDAVVVPGTGILDDMKTRPNQTPSDLFRWTMLARLAHRPWLMIGVGAGPIDNKASRWLMRCAVRRSTRVTYRDEGSRAFMSSLGVPEEPQSVQPDLAFALPRPPDVRSGRSGEPLIGLGVMAYKGWRAMEDAEEREIFSRYVDAMVQVALLLLQRRYTIRLLVGESVDSAATERLLAALRAERGVGSSLGVEIDRIETMDDLLQQVAFTDAVIATRFHNVVAALMVGRPVVSIGYANKNRELMSAFGLAEHCFDVDSFDPVEVVDHLDRVFDERVVIGQRLERLNGYVTEEVAVRFDDVLASAFPPRSD
jgi:polysaccharide pyruvyl transferase WcaK-like protein